MKTKDKARPTTTASFRKNKATSFLNSVDRSSIDASKYKSHLSILASNFEAKDDEQPLQKKTTLLLEEIISKYNSTMNETDLNAYCIENSKKDFDYLTSIACTSKSLNDFVFTSPKEEGEHLQLVEKSIVDKLRDENMHYSNALNKLKQKITELKLKLFKATGENNFVKQASDYQNTLKTDNARQLHNMEKMLNECKDMNKVLRDELTSKRVQKDALFRAVYGLIMKYNCEMANEFKHIYQCYNNQYYMINHKGLDEKYIEDLFSQIHVLEGKVSARNKEIKELEKQILVPDKKKKMKKNNTSAKYSSRAVIVAK